MCVTLQYGSIDNLRDAAFDAWMYDPKADQDNRFTTLAAASVRRYYHSVALLLPDGSVMTSGNEYGEAGLAPSYDEALFDISGLNAAAQ